MVLVLSLCFVVALISAFWVAWFLGVLAVGLGLVWG